MHNLVPLSSILIFLVKIYLGQYVLLEFEMLALPALTIQINTEYNTQDLLKTLLLLIFEQHCRSAMEVDLLLQPLQQHIFKYLSFWAVWSAY